MRQNRQDLPYQTLGNRLKNLRERQQKSLIEVSGAVEIDPKDLEDIENGQSKPSEDLLILLINYFKLNDKEADRLWSLANYQASNPMEEAMSKQIAMIMPVDSRVIYTDLVYASTNNRGLVLNFMQQNGSDDKPMIASRVGMSQEQARVLLHTLQKTLLQSQPKALPAPGAKSDNQSKN